MVCVDVYCTISFLAIYIHDLTRSVWKSQPLMRKRRRTMCRPSRKRGKPILDASNEAIVLEWFRRERCLWARPSDGGESFVRSSFICSRKKRFERVIASKDAASR